MHKKVMWLLLGAVFVVGMLSYGCETGEVKKIEKKEEAPAASISPLGCETGGNRDDGLEAVELCVFVCGEVQAPGVYRVAKDARIVDAIEAAGGFTENAAKEYWNLAQPLTDGQKIWVPDLTEVSALPPEEGNLSGSWREDGRLNINLAGKEELMELPGIGEKRAEDILSFREENGAFSSTEQIKEVSGIKDSIYEEIKDKITVN